MNIRKSPLTSPAPEIAEERRYLQNVLYIVTGAILLTSVVVLAVSLMVQYTVVAMVMGSATLILVSVIKYSPLARAGV